MNIKQIRAFLALSHTLNFVQAANQLHLSQPALSLSIKSLEEDLGGKLFIRTTRSMTLTPEGEALVPIAKQLLAHWENAEEEMKQRFALQRGRISIASMPVFAASLLPKAIRNYHQAYPKVKVAIHDVLSDKVEEMVRTNQVELGISFEPENLNKLSFHPLYEDEFIAILPPQHPLNQHTSLTWSELMENDFISLQRPSNVRNKIETELKKHQLELGVAFDAHQLNTVCRMVSEGMGVAVVPALCKKQAEEQGAICHTISHPAIKWRVGVICQPRSSLSVAASAMLNTLISTYR